MERIAITGYTGFIGQRLMERLLKQGHIVYPVGREARSVECDRVYHLACPSSSASINSNPIEVMDTIMDVTRSALTISDSAIFINASSMGASCVLGHEVDYTPQTGYNVAKLCMEAYLHNCGRQFINYRLPSIYGSGMSDDTFISRCMSKTAHYPFEPNKLHYIAHIDDVIESLVNLKPVHSETITLGDIYEQFTSGRRGIHRPTSNTPSASN